MAKKTPVRVGFTANTDPDMSYRWTVEREYSDNTIEVPHFIDSVTAYDFAVSQMKLIKMAKST